MIFARFCRAAILALLALLLVQAAQADTTVFAAASLSDVLKQVGDAYNASTGHRVIFSFAASSLLARQIESSPGADIFISADTEWMDYLDKRGLIVHGARIDLLGNRLVLIAPVESKVALVLKPGLNLLSALDGGRLALADPSSVPAGKYAKAALTTLEVWDAVENQIAPAENVRVALAYVARGETPLGIVYATDAKAEPKVRIVAEFPENTHPPIVYPAALTKDAGAEARMFFAYLSSERARILFETAGFAPP